MKLATIASLLALALAACVAPERAAIGVDDPARPAPASAFEALGCSIPRVVDGDTIVIACPGRGTRNVRLTGYDTPETFRPGCATERARGQAATQRLRILIAQAKTVDLRASGTDRYGRILAALFLDGASVARRMIAEGHAVPYDGGRRPDWCG